MKKQLLSVLSFLMLCIGIQAQTNIANYTFTTSAGTYVPLTGATTFTTSWDSEVATNIPLGGSFTYGAATFTSCNVFANGFISFGGAISVSAPLSSGTFSGAVSAFGQDGANSTAAGATPSISYMNIGGAAGEFVIQYTDHANFANRINERLNFQIRLNLATGGINIVYGSWSVLGATGTTALVGIRGNTTTWASNVNSLNTVNIPAGTSCTWADAITSVANNSSMYSNPTNTLIAPSNGLTYSWNPPVNPTLAPVRSFGAVSGITSASAVLSWTAPTGATQFNVQYRIPGTCSWTNFVGNPVSVNTATLTGLNFSTVYQIRVQSSDGTNNAIWSHIPNQAGTGGGYNTAAGTFSTLGIPVDLQTTSLQAPTVSATGCYGSSVPVVIQIKNAGTTILDFSLNNATVVTNITGTNPQSFTTTVNTGTLAAGATQNVTVTTTYNMSAVGVYSINASSTLATPDANTTNDAMATATRTTTAATPLPHFEGFAAGVLPAGWLNSSTWSFATNHGVSDYGVYKNLWSSATTGSLSLLKLGTLTGAESIAFDFRVLNYNATYPGIQVPPTGNWGNVKIQVSTDCGSTFTDIGTIDNTTHTITTQAFTNKVYSLAAYAGQNVIIRLVGTWVAGDYYVDMDNFNIASCFAPTGLTTSNITTTSTDISWTAPITGSPASYIGEIRTSGAAGSGTLGLVSTGTVTAPTTTTNITGLTALTAYTVYVRSDCGASDFSQWIATTFTTLADCQVPTALNTTTVLATSANFTWTAGGIETAWDIYYGSQPLTVPNATTAPTATSSIASYSVTGLTQATAYSIYVRANCGAGNSSVWTAVKNFTTTLSCPAPSTVTISGITPTSANATWLAGSSETSWLVNYMAPTTTVVTASPSYSLTGLNPSISYSIQVKGICAVGDSSTWTAFTTFMTPCLPPSILTTTPSTRCGTGTTTLAATGDVGATLNWYANSTGGVSVGTGTLFTTPTITTTTDFYVSAIGALTSGTGGRTVPTATANTTASNYGLVFDATKNFTLNSVDVFPTGAAGTLVVNLTNNLGAVLQTATISIPTGTVGTAYSVNLNFPITTGTGYRLIAVSSPNMIRELSVGGFPYALGQVGNITSGYISGTSTTYYYFYNWNFSYGCESTRTAVTASVTTPPVLSVTSGTTICANAIQSLSVTSTLSDFDNYVWTPSTNLFTDGSATTAYTGNNQSILYYSSPLNNNTTYTLTATNTSNGCVNNTTVSMEATMPVIYASANPTIVCSGNTVQLTANTDIIATGTVAIGTATTLTGATAQPTAFCNRWPSYRMQTVYTAAELTATGLTSGNITSISYSISSLGDGATNPNFTVKCGTTTATAFTNFIATTGFSTVFTPAIYTHSVGLNTIIFNTPYFWDGVSNLVIEVSHDGADLTNNSQTYYTATVANTVAWSNSGNATGTPSKNRLNTIINGQKVSQGTGTVNWQWNPGAINSSTAVVNPVNTGTTTTTESYTVTALDPATTCTNSAVVNFSVLPNPTVTATASSASICAGSSATLTATGATNYTWSSGGTSMTEVVTPTVPTTYTLTGEENGCTAMATVSVDVNAIPTLSLTSSTPSICLGSTNATLLASGATNYTWAPTGDMTPSTVVSPTANATYTVTGETAGCSSTGTISIDVFDVPFVVVSPMSTTICAGTSVTLTATGADSYAWDTGDMTAIAVVSPTTNSTYTVVGTNACGTGTVTPMVDVTSLPVVNATTSATLICTGETATLTATGSTSYTWAPGGELTASIVVSPTTTATYTVVGSSSCGTATTTIQQDVSLCTGLTNLAVTSKVSLFPNPNTGSVNITISNELTGNITLQVYDAIGKLVITQNLTNDVNTINTSKLEAGIYIYKIINNNQDVKVGKMIKH